MCGATREAANQTTVKQGLSPRVWGNLDYLLDTRQHRGSIPTCVGQPNCHQFEFRTSRVYPHVCGATFASVYLSILGEGLSPRVWGNLYAACCALIPAGSIPTCVGQPGIEKSRVAVTSVYPHVCGATQRTHQTHQYLLGLSPRVWGNPSCRGAVWEDARSIPTCVGQPCMLGRRHYLNQVYPHVCGATERVA